MQAIDHILYTYAADHGPGPYVPRICEEYEEQFGHPAKDDFPEWEPCHDILMANNVMGIENLGGDLDKVTNQRFLFHLTESTEAYRIKNILTAYINHYCVFIKKVIYKVGSRHLERSFY